MSERIEIKSEGKYPDPYVVVYLDGEPVRRFHSISDDYAWANARDYAEELKRKLQIERKSYD